ncbi:hypothetical protein [Sphingosinithalassobacter sp. LHW66-3]
MAQRWRVPTINGCSTFAPLEWRFTAPRAADYEARVAAHASNPRGISVG